ncbi:amidohydrolase family protein [Cohnella sp. CFH 77786]|nr:amidohydrolase family protein [Cohnella sp. CFH 77786]
MEAINVRLPLTDREGLFRLAIRDGRFASIEPQPEWIVSERHVPIGSLSLERLGAAAAIDLQGRVMLPGFVDAHMHLDKAYSLPHVGNRSGTLLEAIENYRSAAPSFSKETIRGRIVKAALNAASFGTTALRSHLDVPLMHSRELAMRTIEAALEAREMVSEYVGIQFFPMYYHDPGRERELNEFAAETLRMGIDGVGGAPHLTPDPAGGIDWAFRTALAFDRPIDLHTDESDDPEVKTIDILCDYVLRHGYAGRATAGHLCSLSAMEQGEADRLMGKMASAGIGAVTLPAVNLYLQGRGDRGNVRRGVTRVRELRKAGVRIAAASDNIQDPFHPFGRGDLLQIGLMTAYAAHLAGEEDLYEVLRMLTELPASILGLQDYGVSAGKPAGFVVLDAASAEQALQELPSSRWVYNKSRWIHASETRKEWADPHMA